MTTNSILVAALAAFSAATIAPAQQAHVRLSGGNVEARITEPNGVDHYLVFQGAGIGGKVEIPATLAGCASPIFITIGPLNAHNHQHTVDWVDCKNIQRRWVLAVPVANRWLAGTPQPVSSPYGFGCGTQSALELDIDAPPALGSSRTLTVNNVTPATTLVGILLAFDQAAPAYPLTALGLPAAECFVFIDLSSAMTVGVGPASCSAPSFPLALPAAPALTSVVVHTQAIALSPGENPAGVVTSNGLNLVLAQ